MNYPQGVKKQYNKIIDYKNRGMKLEDDINVTNKYYLDNNIAVIYKKPTPIALVKVDYKNNVINEAYFKTPSTTDYNGIYKGKYIDFEAKETTSKTSFPLSNIHEHQVIHLKKVIEHGGISFIIVRFTSFSETYLLETEYIDVGNRKSIPYSHFKKYGYLIKEGYSIRLDYLKIVDKLGGTNEKEKN